MVNAQKSAEQTTLIPVTVESVNIDFLLIDRNLNHYGVTVVNLIEITSE